MARIPTAVDMGQRPIPRSRRGAPQISLGDATAPAQAAEGLGEEVTQIGEVMADREFTALAKERDAYVAEELRRILYDPEDGFTTKQGRTALEARAFALDQIKKLKNSALKDMPSAASRKLESSLQSRIESAHLTVDKHTGAARNDWLNGASEARVNAALEDSLSDPDMLDAALSTIRSEYQGRAAREGWSREEYEFELSQAESTLFKNETLRIADLNPEKALAFLEEHQDQIQPSEYLVLKGKIEPLAKKEAGRRIGRLAAMQGVSEAYLVAIRAAESGGNDSAKNPRSTATGRYQFTAGTWADVMRKHPELGLTADGRLDPTQQELAIRAFTADNANILMGSGIEPTAGNLYAAHFLGAGSALVVLRASDVVPMSDLVSPSVIKANPFLADMTAGQFRAWSQRKGGGSEIAFSETAGGIAEVLEAAGDDPDIRAAAITEFNLQQSATLAASELESAELGVRVTTGEASQQEIDAARDAGKITPSRWETLTEQRITLEDKRIKDGKAIEDFRTHLEQGGKGNSYSSDHRKAVDLLDDQLSAQVEAAGGAAEDLTTARISMLGTTGVAPKGLVEDLRGGIASRSEEALLLADQAMQVAPQAFSGVEGGSSIETAVRAFRAYARVGMSSEQAARLAMPTPEEKEQNAAADAQINKELKEIDASVINQSFDSWLPFDAVQLPPQTETSALRDYEVLYRAARRDGILPEAAHEYAMAGLADPINGLYGVSAFASGSFSAAKDPNFIVSGLSVGDVTGQDNAGSARGVMRLPPERFYPKVDGGHEYIAEDITQSLASIDGWDGGDWWLVADESETDRAVRLSQRGQAELPGYRVYFINDRGELNFRYWRMETDDIAALQETAREKNAAAFEVERRASEIDPKTGKPKGNIRYGNGVAEKFLQPSEEGK